MASDTYYKDMWLRRNKTAIQVVIVLLSIMVLILIIQTAYRRHPGMGHTLQGEGHAGAIDKMIAEQGHVRGRVFGHDEEEDDDLDDNVDVDAGDEDAGQQTKADEPKSDCCTIYDLWKLNHADFECTPLDQLADGLPTALVCFYPDQPAENDKHASLDPLTAKQILTQLQNSGDSVGFIDVGAGVGAYSMLAAAAGHSVLAVEANVNDVTRFHKAAKLGRYEGYITLLNNKVSSDRGEVEVVEGQPKVKQILLDDLPAFCKFRKATMRMNLNGIEHAAFKHAKYLFKEIHITYVFFDWDNLRHLEKDEDVQLVADMIQYFNKRGYVPRGYDGKVLSTKKWHQWPNNIYWQKM